MSITKFKVGDKVRVRNNITGCGDTCRGGVYVNEKMAKIAGAIFTIEGVAKYWYDVAENDWGWNDEMLEPAEKTLETLEVGDLVEDPEGNARKVLAVLGDCYMISCYPNHRMVSGWATVHQIKLANWKIIQPEPAETIKIGGKKYDKQEFEEAIKDLRPID